MTIGPIVRKELRQIVRDPRTLGVLLLLPVFLLVMFGYAISLDVRGIGLVVVDHDRSAESRELVAGFSHCEHFEIRAYEESSARAGDLLHRGRATAVIVIPPDYGARIVAAADPVVQVLVDGSNATTAATALGYIGAVIRDVSRRVMGRPGPRGFGEGVDYRPRVWFNPDLRSTVYLVPGLIAFIMVITAVVSTAMSVVREKERGTWEQILVSPITPLELLVGKTIPYAGLSLLETALILAASRLFFGVVVHGSLLLLFLASFLFLLSCLALGLLISTIAQTQQVAFLLSVMLTILPSFVLSGFVFPIRNMPLPIRLATYLFPARYFVVALRHILIKGVGLGSFWPQLVGLVAFTAVALAAGSLRLRGRA